MHQINYPTKQISRTWLLHNQLERGFYQTKHPLFFVSKIATAPQLRRLWRHIRDCLADHLFVKIYDMTPAVTANVHCTSERLAGILITIMTAQKRTSRNGQTNRHIAEHHLLTNQTIYWDYTFDNTKPTIFNDWFLTTSLQVDYIWQMDLFYFDMAHETNGTNYTDLLQPTNANDS